MFNKLPYKIKMRALNLLGIGMLLVIYQLGIKRTLETRTQLLTAESEAELVKNLPLKIQQLQTEKSKFSAICSKEIRENENQQNLLDFLTKYCQSHEIILREFPETIRTQKTEMQLETNRFMVQGGYFELLQLVFVLEQQQHVGKIASVNYEVKKDIKTKKEFLTATIFIQNLSITS